MREGEVTSRPRAKEMRKALTRTELTVWLNLRQLNKEGYKFRRQHPIGPYIADFVHVRGRLVVETDGATHYSPEALEHDRKRDAYMRSLGRTIIRFTNGAVRNDVSLVIEHMLRRLPLT
jgi:adenine-specific DNA-methyltransferase